MFHRRLSFRLSVVVGLVLAAGLAFLVTLSIRQQDRVLTELKREEASLLADAIKGSLTHAMVRGEDGREAVGAVIREIGERPEIERIRIFDQMGEIRYSTNAAEVGRVADKSEGSCVECHSGDRSGRTLSDVAGGIFYDPTISGEFAHRALGVVHPIRVDEDETCVRCHQEGTVLGILDVVVSLERLDRQIDANRWGMVTLGSVGALATVVIVAVLLHLLVHRPVGSLVDGTRKVARLELDHRLPADRRDELGELAGAFNEMTARLEQARAEIQEFADSLEHKVEEKTAELQVSQLQMLRAEKLAALGRMASGAAHEINNPLAGLIVYAEQLKERTSAGAVGAGELDTIIGEAMRCASIVRNLLDFARDGEFTTEPTDLHSVLERALEGAVASSCAEGVEVVREYAGDLPPVPLQPERAEQAFRNLFSNAIAAMAGRGTLTVTTSLVSGTGDRIVFARIDVEDTGSGIPPEIQGRVFDPFFTTMEPGRGSGLGLSVAHGIVEGHGGDIALDSAPGAGSRFTVRLPLAEFGSRDEGRAGKRNL